MSSLKGWAAGDGCFSKHRASFAKQALIPRPGGPRCLLGGRRGLGALFGRKRGLGNSGTKPGTELAGAAGRAGWIGQGWDASGGSGPCVSDQPPSAWIMQGVSGLLSRGVLALSRTRQALLELQVSWWSAGSGNICLGRRWVKCEIWDRDFPKRWGRKSSHPESTGLHSRT